MPVGRPSALQRAAAPAFALALTLAFAFVPGQPGRAQGRATARDTMRVTPVPGAVSFLAVGDWGKQGDRTQRQVASAMGSAAATLGAQFVLSTGDNFYPNGVRSAADRQFFTSFENVYRDSALAIDWYPALGNHDYHANPDAEVAYSARSSRWRMGARYYAVTKTVAPDVTVEFFIIDTSPFIAEYYSRPWQYAVAATDTAAQRRWLEGALKSSRAQWKFIVGHHHVYTGGARPTQSELEALLVPRMQQYGVFAYLSGHEHHLEHIVPRGSRTHFFISGAGSEARGAKGREGTRFVAATPGFLAFSLTADSVMVQAVDARGRLLYRTRLARG